MGRFLLFFVLFLTACSPQAAIDRIASEEDKTLSVRIVKALQAGDRAGLLELVHPSARSQFSGVFPRMHAAVPRGRDSSMRLVHAGVQSSVSPIEGQVRVAYLTYEVSAAKRYAVAEIVIRQQHGKAYVTDFYVTPTALPATKMSSFGFEGKGALHYLFLVLALASVATIVTALVLLARARGLRRRWMWVVGSLIGFGKFGLNWTTGETLFQPIYVMLLGAGIFKTGLIGPWQLSFGVPVIAILFLVRRRKLLSWRPPETPGATKPGIRIVNRDAAGG